MAWRPVSTTLPLVASYRSASEYVDAAAGPMSAVSVISSVVPRVTTALRDMTERYFFFAPVVVGANTMLIVQLAPAARVVPQVPPARANWFGVVGVEVARVGA